MHFCTIDLPTKTLTINEAVDGTFLLEQLTDLFTNHPNQPFPLDSWESDVLNHQIQVKDVDSVDIPTPSELYMCESEQWLVVNSDLIENVAWVDWKHG